MKLRHPWLIRCVAWLGAATLRAWLRTLRAYMASADGRVHPTDPAQQRFIYAFWHESLLAPAKLRTRVSIMISQSADGELIAQVCKHLGVGTVRGSTSRRAAGGLLDMLRVEGDSHLALTPDGPRGPRRRVQPGIVFLAARTGLPIVPVGVGFTRAWRARSWDRFAIPKPFSTLTGVLGEPIVVSPDLDRAELERECQRVEEAMLAATEAAQRWAEQLACRRPAKNVPQVTPNTTDRGLAPHFTSDCKELVSDGPHRTG